MVAEAGLKTVSRLWTRQGFFNITFIFTLDYINLADAFCPKWHPTIKILPKNCKNHASTLTKYQIVSEWVGSLSQFVGFLPP